MIGIFDSGVGGLSVLAAIRARAPKADIVYFGDTANAPYGPKSQGEIATLISMALRRLHAKGATQIVSACNSASVSILEKPIDLLRLGIFSVIEMIGPTVELLAKHEGKIALFATVATVESGIYQDAFSTTGREITAIAIPELASQIEQGAPEEEMYTVIKRAVDEALAVGATLLVLSCTHYPFVQHIFERCVQEKGSTALVINPADAVAESVANAFSMDGTGKLTVVLSKESLVFKNHLRTIVKDDPCTLVIEESVYHSLKTV